LFLRRKCNISGEFGIIDWKLVMRILFFLGFRNPFPGACWVRVGFFARYFRSRGHVVGVVGVFPVRGFGEAGVEWWDGVKIYNLCPLFMSSRLFLRLLNIFLSIIFLPLIWFAFRPDVSIISVPRGLQSIGAYFASRIVGCRVVFDYRDEWEDYFISNSRSRLHRRFYQFVKGLMTKIYMRCDLVATVTHIFARNLIDRGVRNVKLLPNGADVKLFKPCNRDLARRRLGLSRDDFVLVYSGLIGGYYRLEVILRAMAKLRNRIKNLVFLVVGRGPRLPYILRLSETLGLKKCFRYLGVTYDLGGIAEIYCASDVGVIPGLYAEGQLPVKFFEYGACGLPVIAICPEKSLLARLIRIYGVGLTSPLLDEDVIADLIYKIYSDVPFRLEAGRRARRLVEEKFDRNRVAEDYLRVLEMLRKV